MSFLNTIKDTITKHNKLIIVIVLLMLIQCSVLVYWQGQKGNYFIDELYSFGYAHSFVLDSDAYITDGDDWGYNKWMDNNKLISQLTVSEDESLLSLPASKAVYLLATKRTYMGLLNIIMSKTHPFKGYCANALALNILFYLLAEILLFFIVRTLTRNDKIAVLSLTMFGFSAIIIGMCEYIRFYMLVILLLLIVVFCHLKLCNEVRIRKFLVWELLAFIAALYGLKHSELMLVTCGSFFCFFFVSLLCLKRFRHAAVYGAPLLLGVYFFVYQKTNLLEIVFHPSRFARPGSHGVELVTYNLLTVTPKRAGECICIIGNNIADKWFGGIHVVSAFAVLFIVCIIVMIKNKRFEHFRDRKTHDGYLGFVVLLLLTAAIGITFNALTNIITERHMVFNIVLLMIVFWYCVNVINERIDNKKVIIAFTVITIAGAFACQQSEYYRYLFAEVKEDVGIIEQYNDVDAVIINSFQDGSFYQNKERCAAYDCIIHSGENARIYVVDPLHDEKISEADPPDRFLAWCCNPDGVNKLHKMLKKTDYEITPIGATNLNQVFLCTRE